MRPLALAFLAAFVLPLAAASVEGASYHASSGCGLFVDAPGCTASHQGAFARDDRCVPDALCPVEVSVLAMASGFPPGLATITSDVTGVWTYDAQGNPRTPVPLCNVTTLALSRAAACQGAARAVTRFTMEECAEGTVRTTFLTGGVLTYLESPIAFCAIDTT